MKAKIVLISCIILMVSAIYAQNDSTHNSEVQKYKHLVGFDGTTLLSQVIPFNTLNANTITPALINRRLWNGNGYRLMLGGNITEQNNLDWYYISLGFTRKRNLSKKFNYLTGVDLRNIFSDNGLETIALVPYWGVEYDINEIVSMSTETGLRIGIFDSFEVLGLVPPVNIQFHFNVNRNKAK